MASTFRKVLSGRMVVTIVLGFGGFGSLTVSQAQTPASTPKESSDLASRIQDPNQRVVPTLDHANTRFSTLDQINTHNAGQLRIDKFKCGAVRRDIPAHSIGGSGAVLATWIL